MSFSITIPAAFPHNTLQVLLLALWFKMFTTALSCSDSRLSARKPGSQTRGFLRRKLQGEISRVECWINTECWISWPETRMQHLGMYFLGNCQLVSKYIKWTSVCHQAKDIVALPTAGNNRGHHCPAGKNLFRVHFGTWCDEWSQNAWRPPVWLESSVARTKTIHCDKVIFNVSFHLF